MFSLLFFLSVFLKVSSVNGYTPFKHVTWQMNFKLFHKYAYNIIVKELLIVEQYCVKNLAFLKILILMETYIIYFRSDQAYHELRKYERSASGPRNFGQCRTLLGVKNWRRFTFFIYFAFFKFQFLRTKYFVNLSEFNSLYFLYFFHLIHMYAIKLYDITR